MRRKLAVLRLAVYIIGLALIYLIPLSYIEGRSFCVLYNLFGTTCIGCGTTRAVFNILHLNFYTAFNYNKLAFIWFALFLAIVVEDVVKIVKVILNRECKYSLIENGTVYLKNSVEKVWCK